MRLFQITHMIVSYCTSVDLLGKLEHAIYKPHTSHIQGTYKAHTRHIQATYKPHTRHIQATYKPHTQYLTGNTPGPLLFPKCITCYTWLTLRGYLGLADNIGASELRLKPTAHQPIFHQLINNLQLSANVLQIPTRSRLVK